MITAICRIMDAEDVYYDTEGQVMTYSHIINPHLLDKGFSVIKKTTYEREEKDKTVEAFTSERVYDFNDPDDRKELLNIMLGHMMPGFTHREEGLQNLKNELDEVFKEIEDELPFL